MRRFSKSLIALFTTLVLALSGLAISPANAVDSVVDVDCGGVNFRVTTIGADVTVSNGDRCIGDVLIPAGVTSIEYHAFFRANRITSITIPASVTSIQPSAFVGATELTSVFFQMTACLPSSGGVPSVAQPNLIQLRSPPVLTLSQPRPSEAQRHLLPLLLLALV